MIAVDTNIVVRFIVADDLRQAAIAQAQIERGVFLSFGVLMETEWVLRHSYGFDREQVAQELMKLVELERVEVPQPEHLLWALARHREGADLADMLHLVAARGRTAFATFDRALAKAADPGAPLPIKLLE